jgi:hypothetical protein
MSLAVDMEIESTVIIQTLEYTKDRYNVKIRK